jgi:hypothetical protein
VLEQMVKIEYAGTDENEADRYTKRLETVWRVLCLQGHGGGQRA